MILIVSNSLDETANVVNRELTKIGTQVARLDTDILDLENSSLEYDGNRKLEMLINGETYTPEDFHFVWFRRPKNLSIPNTSDFYSDQLTKFEWPESLEGFLANIPESKWMNHPRNILSASSKIEQLCRAQDIGFKIPKTLLTRDGNKAIDFFYEIDGNVVTKPSAIGHFENQCELGHIYTNRVNEEEILTIRNKKLTYPTLFQELILPKTDVRVTVFDRQVFGVNLQNSNGHIDIRYNNMSGVNYSKVTIPKYIEVTILEMVESYGLRFAALDFVLDDFGNWHFLEINPNGQWVWLDQQGQDFGLFKYFTRQYG